MPFENPLKRLWSENCTAANGWLAIPSVLSAEAMARSGFDSVTIDLQHGTADYADMLGMLPVIQQTGTTPMVRVPWNDPAQVMRALDAGALGIICPMIEDAADAARFVSYCRYPPAGMRSSGPIRARLAWGDDYGRVANEQILPIAMIETKTAFEGLDAILDVDGLGGLYIGPSDLSAALGYEPGFDHREPDMMAAIEHILVSARSRGVPACIHCMSPDYAAEMGQKGFSLVTLASDARFLEAGAKAALERFSALRDG